jgi:hypothetical protein
MSVRRRDGTPLWITESESTVSLLQRVDFRATDNQKYDEVWLQRLLFNYPALLPVEQIEPGFGTPIPLCRELTLTFGAGRSGALDNLFATPDGGLVISEAKLWRNPEARRSVVAQAMEYAGAIFRLTYEELQSAVLRARNSEKERFNSIYEIVSQQTSEIDEAQFVDAMSRNLRRGRAIICVIGDGIREDLAPLAELLQSHAGHRFTFALIELAIYDAPQAGVRIVNPSVLAQTALIERGVVQIEDSSDGNRRITIREPAQVPTGSSRSFGISEDEFYDFLQQKAPNIPALVKDFLAKAEALGVSADLQGGLNLKHPSPVGNALNLGTIDKGGFLETGPATWWGRTEIGRRYNETLAKLIKGIVRETKNGKESSVRTASGKMPRVSDLLPAYEVQWLQAIENYIQESFEAAREN